MNEKMYGPIIAHTGNVSPVEDDTIVDVYLRREIDTSHEGYTKGHITEPEFASTWDWSVDTAKPDGGDIIAYRVQL